jgi:hypothetical protein
MRKRKRKKKRKNRMKRMKKRMKKRMRMKKKKKRNKKKRMKKRKLDVFQVGVIMVDLMGNRGGSCTIAGSCFQQIVQIYCFGFFSFFFKIVFIFFFWYTYLKKTFFKIKNEIQN